jgi:hypothetical protein
MEIRDGSPIPGHERDALRMKGTDTEDDCGYKREVSDEHHLILGADLDA